VFVSSWLLDRLYVAYAMLRK